MKSGDSSSTEVKSQHEAGPSAIEKAIARFGTPQERDYCLIVRRDAFEERCRKRGQRAAEVVFLVCRPGGKFLLHTKSFYPPGAYRVLTGGIEEGEDLVAAIFREAREETGLEVSIERFLGILHYRFCWNDQETDFTSYVFLLKKRGGRLAPQDSSERITGYKEVTLDEFPEIARKLEETLPQDWKAWGQFRALAHRFAFEELTVGSRSSG